MNAPVPEELQLFDALPQNYLLLSPAFIILAASDTYLNTTGKTRAEIVGKELFTVFPVAADWAPEVDGGMAHSLNVVLQTKEAHEIPLTRFDTPDESNPAQLRERYWKTMNKPVKDAEGNIRYIIHHSEEVTSRILAENQLKAALEVEQISTKKARLLAEQMTLLFHDVPAQIAIVRGDDMVYEYVNPQYEKELFPGRNVLGMPLLDALPEIKGQPIWYILQKVYRTGVPFIRNEIQVPLASKMGGPLSDHYFNTVYHPLRDDDGAINGLLSFKYEVTAHVALRKNLEEATTALSVANEQLSASLAALQASHQELQGINEELISTNEELLTAQESLSALNAKLEQRVLERTRQLEDSIEKEQTLNEEITAANEELTSANEEMVATNEELHETQELLRQTLGGLTASEQRFRFMLNAIPQQVWTANPDGTFNYVNDVIGKDFGYDGQQIIGRGWQKFVHPDDLPVCIASWQHARATGTEYQAEFRLRMKDGSYIWHLARAVPYLEEGKVTLWLGTNTDINVQKNNEQRKDEFLSIASHELKTPLTSIKGFNQLMQRVKDPDKLQSFINKSVEQVFRLEKLINDLLDVTRINAGKMVYDMQPFDFSEMLRDALESVQLKTEHHQLILAESDHVVYTGDRLRLEQVINNFLTNAIKYSPEAREVLVKSLLQDDSIVVSVQDFGIGIPDTHLDKLFDRYYRVDNGAMRFEGLGLGLFISSEILKRHQGTFWIESEEGKGSTFYFRLPLQMHTQDVVIVQEEGYYKDAHITIIHNPQKNRLDVDWTGYQDMTTVKRGGMLMLEMMKEAQVHKILNDNTHVLGNWSEAADWAGQEWFPLMEAGGLRYFAWIYSPSTFSKFSAEKSASGKLGNVVTQFFDDIGTAMQWLDDVF